LSAHPPSCAHVPFQAFLKQTTAPAYTRLRDYNFFQAILQVSKFYNSSSVKILQFFKCQNFTILQVSKFYNFQASLNHRANACSCLHTYILSKLCLLKREIWI
jgi:hypothetical protein